MSTIHSIHVGHNCILRPMESADVHAVAAISCECVGKGLYSPEEIAGTVASDQRFIYVLDVGNGEIAGYIYFLLTDIKRTAADMKLGRERLQAVCGSGEPVLGRIQSVAIRSAFRGYGFSRKLLQFALAVLAKKRAECVFIACWKKGQDVPLGAAVRSCGFCFLAEVENAWFDNEKLYCPYCRGRCRCSAEIYYRCISDQPQLAGL